MDVDTVTNLTALGVVCSTFLWGLRVGIPAFLGSLREQRETFTTELRRMQDSHERQLQLARVEWQAISQESHEAIGRLAAAVDNMDTTFREFVDETRRGSAA